MNTDCKRRSKSSYKKYTLCHKKKIISLSHRKNISCNKAKWKIIPVTESILHVTLTILLVIGVTFTVRWWNIPPCHKKNSLWQEYYLLWQKKYSICHKRIFPVKERIFLVTGNLFLVSQNIFPVNERIFLVPGNKFPVTKRTENTLCQMKNNSWCRRYASCDRLNRLYTCHRNSDILDISCDKKFSSCQTKIFPIDCQNNWLHDIWD